MNTEKVMEVLRQVEWRGYAGAFARRHSGVFAWVCPSCNRYKSQGHRDDCELAALLSEGEKNEPDYIPYAARVFY